MRHSTNLAKTRIPFDQRPTCTIPEACQAIGLGRTKLYELIGRGKLRTTTIGRRRLVVVPSLLSLVNSDADYRREL
jgi:excisionase family DNA binding protein